MSDDNKPPRKDPLARAFLVVVAIVLIVGAALAVRAALSQRGSATTPSSASSATSGAAPSTIGARIRSGIDSFLHMIADMQAPPPEPPVPAPAQRRAMAPATPATPAPLPALAQTSDPQRTYRQAAAPDGPQVAVVPADGQWTYDVYFGPAWQKSGQLRYSTRIQVEQSAKGGALNKLGSNMSWTPVGGQTTSWYFGIVEADHPSHANTRFPGFFMHAAYLPQSMQAGNRLFWEFPWQGGGNGQVRRFDMRVIGWETVQVQAGEFQAVHLDGKLQYVDKDSIKAEVRYAIWYAPRARQVVRVLWLGRAPDESSAEMIAELASFKAP